MTTHRQPPVTAQLPASADPLLGAARARTARLSPAVIAKLAAWTPQLEQRALSARDWDAWSPLVRAAVACAAPRNAAVASDLLGTAVSLVAFADKRRMPLRAELVFRATTGEAFLATVTSTSHPTVASRVRALVAGVDQALADPTPQPAGRDAGESTRPAQESRELEPLLLDVSVTPADAGELVLVLVGDRQVPLHAAFAGPVLFAARVAGDAWVLGGGPAGRADRMSLLAAGLEGANAHLVRMNSARLGATWLAMHATLGVPLGDLVDAAGWSSAEPLTAVLPYLPRNTPSGLTALAGLTGRAVQVEEVPA